MNSPVITSLSTKIHQIVVFLLTLRFGGLFEFTKTINANISIIKNLKTNKIKQQPTTFLQRNLLAEGAVFPETLSH